LRAGAKCPLGYGDATSLLLGFEYGDIGAEYATIDSTRAAIGSLGRVTGIAEEAKLKAGGDGSSEGGASVNEDACDVDPIAVPSVYKPLNPSETPDGLWALSTPRPLDQVTAPLQDRERAHD
jgi:hypothetical protein